MPEEPTFVPILNIDKPIKGIHWGKTSGDRTDRRLVLADGVSVNGDNDDSASRLVSCLVRK
jgi:hypothetical protein